MPSPADEHARNPERHAAKSGRPRPGHAGHPALPHPRDHRALLRAARLHGLPDLLQRARAAGHLRACHERARGLRAAAGARPPGHRVRARLHHRAHRLHLRHQRRHADALAPARAPPRRPRLRPAVPALRRLQGPQLHGARLRQRCRRRRARALRGPAGRLARRLRGDAAGRHPGRGRPLRDAQRDAHQPGHDDQPAGAHPHVRPASLHDGAVGDPAPLPAHPPRGLHRSAPSWAPSWRPSACRWATATRTATGTSTAPSARTRTASWRPGRRSARPPGPRAGSCPRSDRRHACAALDEGGPAVSAVSPVRRVRPRTGR